MKDRIKLAKAMGWKHHDVDNVHKWMPPGRDHCYYKNKACSEIYLPDPFTDANDDYAVLEWMRRKGDLPPEFTTELFAAWYYKVGDYARAALKAENHVL